jgi:hypothetical protein
MNSDINPMSPEQSGLTPQRCWQPFLGQLPSSGHNKLFHIRVQHLLTLNEDKTDGPTKQGYCWSLIEIAFKQPHYKHKTTAQESQQANQQNFVVQLLALFCQFSYSKMVDSYFIFI